MRIHGMTAAALAVIFLLSASAAVRAEQEQPLPRRRPAETEARWRAGVEPDAEMTAAVSRYSAAETEEDKTLARAELKKMLESRTDPRQAALINSLKKLEAAATKISEAAVEKECEDIEKKSEELKLEISRMIREEQAARDQNINSLLERMLAGWARQR